MVLPTLFVDMDSTWERLYVFQPYRSQGSLKDKIYDVRPPHSPVPRGLCLGPGHPPRSYPERTLTHAR